MAGPPAIVDSNVHLWDNAGNPVFWLQDRSLVRDLIGDYYSLPDVYTLDDYERETAGSGVRGIVWSDAGAADPVAAAQWVCEQDSDRGLVTGLVSLGDPATDGFGDLVDRLAPIPLVRSVRVRLATSLVQETQVDVPLLQRPGVAENFRLMAEHNLVATLEGTGDELDQVTRLANALPDLRIVVDHFGWPTDLTDHGREVHLERLAALADQPNVATRIDALGTMFGSWTTDQVRPWLLPVVELFGAHRCMLGSDLPIERLRSSFTRLYEAYDDVFSGYPAPDREQLFAGTAERWYGAQ